MIKQQLKNLISGEGFFKNVLTLMSGSTLAQVVPILISPVLTRFYQSNDFGLYAIFSSMVLVSSCLTTGTYERAVVIPQNDNHAVNILAAVCLATMFVSIVTFVVIVLFIETIISLLQNEDFRGWLYVLPIAFMLNGINLGIIQWATRKAYFKDIAITHVVQSLTTAFINVALGLLAFKGGLIVGLLAGQVVVMFILFSCSWQKDKDIFSQISRRVIKSQVKRFINFPKFSITAGVIETTASQMHILLLSAFFGSSVVGYLALTQRVSSLPMTLVANSVSQVFRQQASHEFAHTGHCNKLFMKTAKSLFAVSIIPFVIVLPIAPDLFAFIFGTEWRTAGEYAQILAVMFFLQFTVSPLSSMFLIAEKQKYDLFIQIMLFTATIAALSSGYYFFQNAKIAIALFVTVYCAKYLFEFYLSYRFAKGTLSSYSS